MLSENLKKVMTDLGYEGGFTLEELMEDTQPYWRTLSRQDSGRFGASGTGFSVGVVQGEESAENALALVWINTYIQFKGQVVKKEKKKKVAVSHMKYKGDPWGDNLLKDKTQ